MYSCNVQLWQVTSLCIVTANCPTVRDCICFQGRQRTINIPQEIGPNYYQFGLHLLDDPNGTRVRNIEHDCREIEQINTEILREWVTRRGKKPVSWQTLIQVFELGDLASEIEVIKLKPTSQIITINFSCWILWFKNINFSTVFSMYHINQSIFVTK